ncbi:transposase [Chloroflexus aurantiacus]|uniref:transposase n=1 Tax=Chloroflexus aurantiacus TaxID=1108 RepID=UPI000A036D24
MTTTSRHTAGAVYAWLAAQPRLRLVTLPPSCAHVNPVETIWLRLKNDIAANRLHGSRHCLLDSVASFFRAMTPAHALTWAAVK